MLVPRVTFDESNVGLTPIREGIRNRIGIVGEFSRGPANEGTFILGYTDFANRYGSDIKKGSLAFQAAYDQGAEDFALVRVLGHAKSAKGSATFSNRALKANTLVFNLKFIGDVVAKNPKVLSSVITTSGKYTGTTSGRYHFKVMSVASGNATVKSVFIPLGASEDNIDYTAPSAISITVNLSADHGVAKSVANGISIYFGTAEQTAPIVLAANDEWSVRVNSHALEIPINEDDLPNQVVSAFIEATVGIEPLGEVTRNSQDDGVVFELAPEVAGLIGNKYSYYFEFVDNVSPGLSVTTKGASNAAFMQGGTDGPRSAYRDFYTLSGTPLLRLIALSEGSWANQIRATIYPINSRQFRLTLEDLNAQNYNPVLEAESYILNFSNVDNTGFISELNDSKFVRGIFLPRLAAEYDASLRFSVPQRIAPPDTTVTDVENPAHVNYYGPSFLTNVSLEGGYDGPAITEDDYIRGLQKLESLAVHIILCPGIHSSPAIKAAMIAHAENASELEGLRVAVLNTKPGLSPNAARQETLGFTSKRAVMVAGWSTYAGQVNAPRYGLSPDAVYAGKLAVTPFYAGPNATRTAGPVQGITEVDTRNYSNRASLQAYTDARLEILALNSLSSGWVFTNGRTLSSDPAWDKVSIRRTYDLIRMDLYDMLQQYKSEPHTFLLRTQIVSAINAYMTEKSREGQIADFQPAVADSTNNTPDNYIKGELNISLSFLPIYAADYINVTLIRDTQTGLVSFSS